jgi:hypothetical protein
MGDWILLTIGDDNDSEITNCSFEGAIFSIWNGDSGSLLFLMVEMS